jgi:hypothetical protein
MLSLSAPEGALKVSVPGASAWAAGAASAIAPVARTVAVPIAMRLGRRFVDTVGLAFRQRWEEQVELCDEKSTGVSR